MGNPKSSSITTNVTTQTHESQQESYMYLQTQRARCRQTPKWMPREMFPGSKHIRFHNTQRAHHWGTVLAEHPAEPQAVPGHSTDTGHQSTKIFWPLRAICTQLGVRSSIWLRGRGSTIPLLGVANHKDKAANWRVWDFDLWVSTNNLWDSIRNLLSIFIYNEVDSLD